MRFLDDPPRHLFFTGKGGVGKTSIACAAALHLAAQAASTEGASATYADRRPTRLGRLHQPAVAADRAGGRERARASGWCRPLALELARPLALQLARGCQAESSAALVLSAGVEPAGGTHQGGTSGGEVDELLS